MIVSCLPSEIVTSFSIAWQASMPAARNWQSAKFVPGNVPLSAPHIWLKSQETVKEAMEILAFARFSSGNPPAELNTGTNAMGITSITVSLETISSKTDECVKLVSTWQ